MLSDDRLKELTKGSRQCLLFSRKIAEAQEKETLQSERSKMVRYLENNLFPNNTQSKNTLLQIQKQILLGTYINLDKVNNETV